MMRGRIAGLVVWGLIALILAATPLVAQERDDRYFTLRDPFRTERNYVPRMRWAPPVVVDVPTRQARPLEPPNTESQGTAYPSAKEADEARTSQALEYIAVFGDSLASRSPRGSPIRSSRICRKLPSSTRRGRTPASSATIRSTGSPPRRSC